MLGDLRRSETRGDALTRIRRRAAAGIRSVPGRGATVGSNEDPARAGASARSGTKRPAAWYVDQWTRLARAVFGLDTGPAHGAQVDAKRSREAVETARRQRAEAVLAESLALGESLERAVYRSVDALAVFKEAPAAWSLAEGVGRRPEGAIASIVGHAVLLHRRRQYDRIWPRIRDLDDATLAAWLPVEAVDAALSTGTAADRQRAIAIGTPTPAMDAGVLVDLAGRFLVGRRATDGRRPGR